MRMLAIFLLGMGLASAMFVSAVLIACSKLGADLHQYEQENGR